MAIAGYGGGKRRKPKLIARNNRENGMALKMAKRLALRRIGLNTAYRK
jgi:hypothetical protein